MIYDQVEGIYTIVNANVATDLAALATAKGVTITTTATVVKRQNADTFVRLNVALPAVGIYVVRAVAAMKSQAQRYVTGSAVLDYYAIDTDPFRLAIQAELAAEALLKSVDRLVASDIFGAAVLDDSLTVEMGDGYQETTGVSYWRRALVRFPAYDRDTGL